MATIIPRPSLAYSAPDSLKAAPPLDPVRERPEDDGYVPLAGVMREIAREMHADGVLVAWHEGDDAPVFLFASGACQPASDIEREMLESAALAAAIRPAVSQSSWQTIEDGSTRSGVLTTSVPSGGAVVTVTTLFKRIGATTKARTRETAQRLLPIVQGFFGLWGLRARAMARVRGLTAAINRSDVGVVLVDRQGRITFANAVAELLIAENDGLRRSGHTLCASKLADTLRLQASIQHVTAEHQLPASPASAPVVALQRKSRRPLMAAIVPVETASPGAEECAATVYLFDPDQDLRPLLEPVCRLYGLSPVESRLTCLLADGISLGDAARTMRVQEQTARSYLKQIFLKTDTNRQAELVWLMLKSSVRTTPECHPSFV